MGRRGVWRVVRRNFFFYLSSCPETCLSAAVLASWQFQGGGVKCLRLLGTHRDPKPKPTLELQKLASPLSTKDSRFVSVHLIYNNNINKAWQCIPNWRHFRYFYRSHFTKWANTTNAMYRISWCLWKDRDVGINGNIFVSQHCIYSVSQLGFTLSPLYQMKIMYE